MVDVAFERGETGKRSRLGESWGEKRCRTAVTVDKQRQIFEAGPASAGKGLKGRLTSEAGLEMSSRSGTKRRGRHVTGDPQG